MLLGGAVSTIAMARILGPEGLGVVTYAAWLAGITIMLGDLGIPGALARYLPDLRRRREDAQADGLTVYLLRRFTMACSLVALGLAGIGVGLWLLRQPGSWEITPSQYLANPLFWVLVAGGVVGQSAAGFTVGLLRGRQEFGRMARVMLAAALTQVAASVSGATMFGIGGALLGGVFVGLIPAVFLAGAVHSGAPVEPELRRRVGRYCRATWASYLLAAIVWTRTEIFFLERGWGSGTVALFAVGITLANLAVQAPLLLTGSLLPHLAQHVAAGEHAEAVAIYRTGMRVLAMMVIPACFGVAAIAPALVPLLYGGGFGDAVLPATILVGASALSTLTAVTHLFMNASERNGFNVVVGAVSAVALVAAGLTVIQSQGVVAAAAARTGIQFVTAAVSLWYVHHHLDAPAPLGAVARITAAAALSAAAAHAVVLAVPGPVAVLPAIPAGIVVYALGLKLFSCVGEPELRLVRGLADSLPGRLPQLMNGAVRFYAPAELRQS
jgi:O-antigen/teichoic acid export membrane protein